MKRKDWLHQLCMKTTSANIAKALLLQCERDYDLMINVTKSGANKLLRKVWESFITTSDRIVLREHQKSLQTKQRFENQLKAA